MGHDRVPYVTRARYSETEGVNETWTFTLEPGIGKDNTTYPYVIVNEWVSANIAQFLQLPIAPFGLFQKTDRRTLMFGSINFAGDSTPKNVRPDECWREFPELCTGIVIFDILVANADRHRGNIKVDNPYKPSAVHIFDHDRTLLHCEKAKGITRLRALEGRLGISAGPISEGNRHCLLDVIDTSKFFFDWYDRVYALPQTFIKSVCKRVEGNGATKPELSEIVRFIDDRRRTMADIIRTHRDDFPNVKDWPLLT